MKKPNADRCLFLSGNQRSGKTLLQLILCSHPEISISPGSKTIPALFNRFPHHRPLTGSEVEQLRKIMRKDRKLGAWRVGRDELERRLLGAPNLLARDVIVGLMKHFRDETKPDASYIGNKKGFYAKSGDVAKKVLPEAKLVFMMRDGRAAVSSMIANQGHDALSGSLVWRAKASRIRQLSQMYPDSCFIVRYERLVTQPEEMCRDLCRFLEIGYSARMLSEYRHNDAVRHTTDQSHPETYQAITTDFIVRWRSRLTSEQVRIIEAVAGMELRAHGYALENPEVLHSWDRLRYMPHVLNDFWTWWIGHVERYRNLGLL